MNAKGLLVLISFAAHFMVTRQTAVYIDNEVLGAPSIDCEVDSIIATFSTRRPFYGRLFVKGHSSNSECVVDYSSYSFGSSRSYNTTIRVPYGSCDVRRERSVSPRGVHMSSSLVIQFHSVFITKVDRSYRISCFYKEAIHTVANELDVGMLTTENMVDTFQMPVCSYSLRQESSNGPVVKYAKVGDRVVHRWECQSPGVESKDNPYGMLVHSCVADDGGGNKVAVVDEQGCSIDPYILGHLSYDEHLLLAYREAHVFKFADQNSLLFSCQIRLCVKTVDACVGMTPPKCSPLRNKRAAAQRSSTKEGMNETKNDENVDVTTDQFLVLDNDDLSSASLNDIGNQMEGFLCVQYVAVASFLGCTILLVVILLTSCSLLCCYGCRRKNGLTEWFTGKSLDKFTTKIHLFENDPIG